MYFVVDNALSAMVLWYSFDGLVIGLNDRSVFPSSMILWFSVTGCMHAGLFPGKYHFETNRASSCSHFPTVGSCLSKSTTFLTAYELSAFLLTTWKAIWFLQTDKEVKLSVSQGMHHYSLDVSRSLPAAHSCRKTPPAKWLGWKQCSMESCLPFAIGSSCAGCKF